MKGFDLTDGPVQAHRLRSWARWAAIILGTIAGIVSLGAGGQSFFVAREGREVIGAVLGMMMLLPLTMIGIFKPRPAAYGMFGSAFVFLAAFIILAPQSDRTTFVGTAEVLLTLVAPGCVVAGLLLYASGNEAKSRQTADQESEAAGVTEGTRFWASSERRKQAHWAAVLLGLISGALEWPWGRHSVVLSAGRGDWWSVAGMAAVSLALLPLSILAVFKPRIAAYGAVANLVVAWVYLIFLSQPAPFTLTQIIVSLYVSGPLMVVAALLFYASSQGGGQTGENN